MSVLVCSRDNKNSTEQRADAIAIDAWNFMAREHQTKKPTLEKQNLEKELTNKVIKVTKLKLQHSGYVLESTK